MSWILYCVTLPYTLLVGYGWVLLMVCIGAAKAPKFDVGYGILTAEWRSWAAKTWKFSTTLGRGIIYSPGARDDMFGPSNRTECHEIVHVRQVEDLMCLSLLVGIIVWVITSNWLLGLLIWFSGGLWMGLGYVTAALRYGIKNMYRDSEYELSAYAQTDIRPGSSHSWLYFRKKLR